MIPGFTSGDFDRIGLFADVALTWCEKKFEYFSEPLKRWYKVLVYSPAKDHFSSAYFDRSIDQEEKLTESDRNFRTFFETLDDLIFIGNEQVEEEVLRDFAATERKFGE